MPQPDLLAWALSAHGVIALLALGGGLERYSERADLYSKSVQETEELVAKMRRSITGELEGRLSVLFENHLRAEPTIIVDAAQQQYREDPLSPIGSDRFRETLQRFVEGGAESIRHYQETMRAHHRWCLWARIRRWDVFALSAWEVLCVAGLGVAGKLFGTQFSNDALVWSFAPTALAAVGFFVCEFGLLLQQDVVDGKRSRYQGL